MSDLNRRELLRILATSSLATALPWSAADLGRATEQARRARQAAAAAGEAYQPRFFTQHEWDTVRALVDLVIPRDERSGSATEALVPEFMDFMMLERPDGQRWMRGGLAWLDLECRERFGQRFAQVADAERATVLDDIAWPARAGPEMSHGVAFFTRFRDLTAAGFFSSKMGVADLQYQGNTFIAQWNGCPPQALQKLGVRYD